MTRRFAYVAAGLAAGFSGLAVLAYILTPVSMDRWNPWLTGPKPPGPTEPGPDALQKNVENFESQSTAYDPGGSNMGGGGTSAN